MFDYKTMLGCLFILLVFAKSFQLIKSYIQNTSSGSLVQVGQASSMVGGTFYVSTSKLLTFAEDFLG